MCAAVAHFAADYISSVLNSDGIGLSRIGFLDTWPILEEIDRTQIEKGSLRKIIKYMAKVCWN